MDERRRNVVFDLGGVVLTWDPEALATATYPDPNIRTRILSGFLRHPDWRELDRGTLDPETAVRRAAARTALPEAAVALFLAQARDALVPIPETVELLRDLNRAGHPLYCLSNMHHAFIDHLERGHDALWALFDGMVVSCRVRMVKPERGIYLHLLDTHALDPAMTVFVDDALANVEAAERLGMRAIRFENARQCRRELLGLDCPRDAS